jgi:hypothetical protein
VLLCRRTAVSRHMQTTTMPRPYRDHLSGESAAGSWPDHLLLGLLIALLLLLNLLLKLPLLLKVLIVLMACDATTNST